MKRARLLLCLAASAVAGRAADEFFDRVQDALTFAAPDSRVRARLSGMIDWEAYAFQLPAPGVLRSGDDTLTAPRLSLFLDAQLGRGIYLFAQARADRGFDPGDGGSTVRLDEYAVRVTLWREARMNLQIGKFATVVGNWVSRHDSWTNPFITAPLPYEYLTGVWDVEGARSATQLMQWSHVRPGLPAAITAIEKSRRVPIVWGPSYAPGFAVSGEAGRWRLASELKLGALSSRPDAWQHGWEQRTHPTVSARLGYRPNQMWNVGVSVSDGTYLREFAPRIPAGRPRGDYEEIVVGQDVTFAWHHLQLWNEIYAARFKIPGVDDAGTLAYYTEAKYKFTPQFFGALRWNQQIFSRVQDRFGRAPWTKDVSRIDLAPGYRFTPHTQMKLQYSLQHGDSGTRRYTRTLAAQLTARF